VALTGVMMIGLWLLAGLPVLLAMRWADSRRWPSWSLVLGKDGHDQLEYLARQTQAQLQVVGSTYEFAQARHEQGAHADAARLLDTACLLIERYAPNMVTQLQHVLELSRAVSALAPVQPLRVGDFRLRELRGLFAAARALHALLITTGERFRLKVHLLVRAFGIVMRTARGAARRVESHPTRTWEEVQALRVDLSTLNRESLDVCRALLLSLQRASVPTVAARALG
jgi:hypothetical protein